MSISGDGGGGAAAGFEPTRLSRFRSAPASWFDSLLPDDELLPQTQCLSQAPVNSSSTTNFRNSPRMKNREEGSPSVTLPNFGRSPTSLDQSLHNVTHLSCWAELRFLVTCECFYLSSTSSSRNYQTGNTNFFRYHGIFTRATGNGSLM
ncbi:hypothetical protein NE237_020857 [Protea cynaroides]|uniref:Uncharacterized protein n=1 Tax=Protea cynaroides TaxID=273540 RepID=A0A9Q0K2Z3_9MAGN|nr:hypothetical protein NE237_020857 [Protea cynaroides]